MFGKSKPLKKPDDESHAYEYALFLLNLRLRTEGEMRKKMKDRGYYQNIIEVTIKKLFLDRYLNDENYADIYIENMKLYKQYGHFMMKKKLMEKLLSKELIEVKLDELVSIADERVIAERYVKKEFGSLTEIKKLPYEEKQKITRRLLSRGFRLDALKI